MNNVIGGDYIGYKILFFKGGIRLSRISHEILIYKSDVASLDIISTDTRRSGTRMLGKGLLWSIFGKLGGLIGAASAKEEKNYMLSMRLQSGRSCLLEVDEKRYRKLMKKLYC